MPAESKLTVDALISLAKMSMLSSHPQENLKRLAAAEKKLKVAPDRASAVELKRLMALHEIRGQVCYFLTDPQAAHDHFNSMAEMARRLNDSLSVAVAAGLNGRVLALQGYVTRALPMLKVSLKPLVESGLPQEWIWTQCFIGLCLTLQGKYEAGLMAVHSALIRALNIHVLTAEVICRAFKVMLYWQTGDIEALLAESQKTLDIAADSGDLLPAYLVYGFRAWALARANHPDEATASFIQFEETAAAMGGRWLLADWFAAARAEMALLAGHYDDALALAEQALQFAEAVDSALATGIAYRVLGETLLHLQAADAPTIEQYFEAAPGALKTGGLYSELHRTQQLWERLLSR